MHGAGQLSTFTPKIMKQLFIKKKFNASARELIGQCNDIITIYSRDGYDLSLRQLYYQLVSKNIVENTEKSYKRVGSIISDARLAGLVDWDMILDRGRETHINSHWESPAEIIENCADSFYMDLWEEQPNHVEVMVEKQALEGVLLPVCKKEDVAFSANKGYSSSSALYEAGRRLARKRRAGKNLFVLYLGDHDPSGLDMTRDIQERLCLFSRSNVEVRRLALNRDQIDELNPPENPAKMTDSRAEAYVAEHGDSSWELDAIEPRRLAEIVKDAIAELRDEELWSEAESKVEQYKEQIREFAEKFKS